MANSEVVRVTLRLPQEIWDRVRHCAVDEHITATEFVIRALREYLKDWK